MGNTEKTNNKKEDVLEKDKKEKTPEQANQEIPTIMPTMIDESVIDKKGIMVDAKISSELLLTIFFNKTPLHDGAVVIERGRIAYAGAILPLSKNNLNWKYGTRHRAALGLSEVSSAVILVVSEESGDISIAEKGKFIKYEDMKKLRARLEKVLNR